MHRNVTQGPTHSNESELALLPCWGWGSEVHTRVWHLLVKTQASLSTSSKGPVNICEVYGEENCQHYDRRQDGLRTLLLLWGVIILFASLWILICIIRRLLEKLISRILIMQSEISQQLTQMSVSYYWDWLPCLAFLGLFWGVGPVLTLNGPTHHISSDYRLVEQLV